MDNWGKGKSKGRLKGNFPKKFIKEVKTVQGSQKICQQVI